MTYPLARKVAIVGAGGHGDTVAECLDPYGVPTMRLCEYDTTKVHPVEFFKEQRHVAEYEAIVAIGDNEARRRLCDWLGTRGVRSALVLHPTSYVSTSARMGSGTVILYGAHIGTKVSIGHGCIVNNLASIGHDCQLGDFVNVCDGTMFGGSVVVEDDVFIGLNATILPKVRIGKGATVGAGAVVTKDVPAGMTVAGNPAGPLR